MGSNCPESAEGARDEHDCNDRTLDGSDPPGGVFGTSAAYSEVVAYYRTQLRDKGDVVYEQPPTHMFQVGRFREDSMASPPGVTVKDWTWGGSPGYPNPKLGGEPVRYPSVIMIVPPPAAASAK